MRLPAQRPGTHAFSILRGMEADELDERGIAAGRVLCGGPSLWPGGYEMAFLQLWPGHRRLAGMRLQSMADVYAPREVLKAAAAIVLPSRPFDAEARNLARDLSRNFRRDYACDFARYFALYFTSDLASFSKSHFAQHLARYFTCDLAGIFSRNSTHDLARDFTQALIRDFTRQFSRSLARGFFPERPDLGDAKWILDFALCEGYSHGRVAAPSFLAYTNKLPDVAPAAVLAAACRVHYGVVKTLRTLSKVLAAYPKDGDPLWPALARHIAGHRGKLASGGVEDTALLEDLARHPEKREPPLRWGLQYIVRGDVMLEDGTVLTLDALAKEAGVEAPPYLEAMPERFEVDWDAE